MKRFVISAALLLLCLALPASLTAGDKKPVADMSNMHRIFLGWVDLGVDSYKTLGYTFRADWANAIDKENVQFQQDLRGKLSSDRIIVAAKNKEDENTAGNDLYVKFTDVSVDSGYRLHISVHLIDLKTNTEIASIPNLKLNGHLCELEGCLANDLDVVSGQLQLLIQGLPQKKTRMQNN